MRNQNLIKEKLLEIGLDITESQQEQLFRFYELVIKKNEVMNLTAIVEYEDFVLKHFVDSLLLFRTLDLSFEQRILDVGTGAGFPGIPLKIVFPQLEILLLDSLKKRLVFLEEVIKELDLLGIRTIHSRVEELQAKGDYRESFDLVVSRAVSSLPTLSEYCLPYVKLGGNFVSYKSIGGDEEIENSKKALSVLGGKILDKKQFFVADFERMLIVIGKVKQTPSKYPRSGGKPSKIPL